METFKRTGNLRLVVGDESYFDEKGKSLHPELTLSHRYKDVDIEASFFSEEEGLVPVTTISIVKTGTEKKISYKNGEVYMKGPGKITSKDLGCDTASYMVNDADISTGADGYYGTYLQNKSTKEVLIILNGGYDYTTLEDFKSNILFGLDFPNESSK